MSAREISATRPSPPGPAADAVRVEPERQVVEEEVHAQERVRQPAREDHLLRRVVRVAVVEGRRRATDSRSRGRRRARRPTSAAASTNERCAAMRASTASCTLTMNTRSPGRRAARTERRRVKSATTTSAPGRSGARAASRTSSVCGTPSPRELRGDHAADLAARAGDDDAGLISLGIGVTLPAPGSRARRGGRTRGAPPAPRARGGKRERAGQPEVLDRQSLRPMSRARAR